MFMYILRLIIITNTILVFSACSNLMSNFQVSDIKNKGKIINLSNQKIISFNELTSSLKEYDIILIGERHDNKNHHIAQMAILKDLMVENPHLNIALEMFDVSKQSNIDIVKLNKYEIKDLKKNISWDDRWNWNYYKDIVFMIINSNAKLLAANITKDEILIIKNGALPLNGIDSTKPYVKNTIKQIISQTHHIQDENLLNNLVQIQQYKDRRMADVINRQKTQTLLIAGRYHTFKDIGVPLHLKDFKNKKRTVVLSLDQSDNLAKFNESDYIWILE